MRLNTDCVRAVLLCVEEYTYRTLDDRNKIVRHSASLHEITKLCKEQGFSEEDIHYCVEILLDNEYLIGWKTTAGIGAVMNMANIDDLTLKGHELLDSIRDEEVYSRTKDVASKMGGLALDGLATAAKVVGKTILKEKFGIDVDI